MTTAGAATAYAPIRNLNSCWIVESKLLIKIRKVRSYVVSIILDAMWRREYCCVSCAGSGKYRAGTGVAALTRVTTKGWSMTWSVIYTIALFGAVVMLECSRCDYGLSFQTNCELSYEGGYRGWMPGCNFFLLSGNILRINQFTNDYSRSTSTPRVFTMSNQGFTCKSPMPTKRRIVPKTCIGCFSALRNFDTH